MQTNNLASSFVFDGKTFTKDNLTFSIERCRVEGVGFDLPPKYGLLLLSEETRVEAQRLLDELEQMSLTVDVNDSLARQVCEEGFCGVWGLLEKYRQNTPSDEPRFYAEYRFGQLDSRVVSLVSREKTVRFTVSGDLQSVLSLLPSNVYQSTVGYSSFRLTFGQYQKLVGREREFYEFISVLDRCFAYVRNNTCVFCFERFFEDSKQAHVMLRQIQSKVGCRVQRDKLYLKLEQEGVLEFSLGLFVRIVWTTFFVSRDGQVHRMCYSSKVVMREAILRAYTKGTLPPPDKLEEVNDDYNLRRIAEIVKKVRPDLAFIILP